MPDDLISVKGRGEQIQYRENPLKANRKGIVGNSSQRPVLANNGSTNPVRHNHNPFGLTGDEDGFTRSPQNSGDHEFAHSRVRCPPTGEELANKLVVKKALDEAFKLSLASKTERGGWIFWNKKTNALSYYIKDPPTINYLHPNDGDTYWQVYLGQPPTPPKGSVIIADFHSVGIGNSPQAAMEKNHVQR